MALTKYTRPLGANLYRDSELFKFDAFSPEHTHKLIEALVHQEGGWSKKDNKVVDAVTKALIWGLERGTNIEKLNKTTEEGVKALNKALKTLKIKAKDPKKLGSNKITISRLMSAYPVMTCEIMMRLGESVVKIGAQNDLPFYFKFPAALSILPQADATLRPKLLAWLAEFDKVINKGTATDEVKRRNFEAVISASPMVPESERVKVVEALSAYYEANKARFLKERTAAKSEADKESLKDAGVEEKTFEEMKKSAIPQAHPDAPVEEKVEMIAEGEPAKSVIWIPDIVKDGSERNYYDAVISGDEMSDAWFSADKKKFLAAFAPLNEKFVQRLAAKRIKAGELEQDEVAILGSNVKYYAKKRFMGVKV